MDKKLGIAIEQFRYGSVPSSFLGSNWHYWMPAIRCLNVGIHVDGKNAEELVPTASFILGKEL